MNLPAFSIGLSTCRNKQMTTFDGFCELKAQGIDAVEISSSSYDEWDFNEIRENAAKAGIQLWSLHLPFIPFEELDPSTLDPRKRQYTFDFMTALILRGCNAGIQKYVIHPSIEPIPDEERDIRLAAAAGFLSELADFAAQYDAVIAVENLPRTCLGRNSDDILRLIADNERLRVCFDTNHLLGEDIPSFIRKVGSRIVTTHVSDYDFLNERHWLPGEGKADWKSIYETLCEIGYSGVWMYELGFAPEKTILRRMLTPRDFHENAVSIFSGQKPAPIGIPVDGLTGWQ